MELFSCKEHIVIYFFNRERKKEETKMPRRSINKYEMAKLFLIRFQECLNGEIINK